MPFQSRHIHSKIFPNFNLQKAILALQSNLTFLKFKLAVGACHFLTPNTRKGQSCPLGRNKIWLRTHFYLLEGTCQQNDKRVSFLYIEKPYCLIYTFGLNFKHLCNLQGSIHYYWRINEPRFKLHAPISIIRPNKEKFVICSVNINTFLFNLLWHMGNFKVCDKD